MPKLITIELTEIEATAIYDAVASFTYRSMVYWDAAREKAGRLVIEKIEAAQRNAVNGHT